MKCFVFSMLVYAREHREQTTGDWERQEEAAHAGWERKQNTKLGLGRAIAFPADRGSCATHNALPLPVISQLNSNLQKRICSIWIIHHQFLSAPVLTSFLPLSLTFRVEKKKMFLCGLKLSKKDPWNDRRNYASCHSRSPSLSLPRSSHNSFELKCNFSLFPGFVCIPLAFWHTLFPFALQQRWLSTFLM